MFHQIAVRLSSSTTFVSFYLNKATDFHCISWPSKTGTLTSVTWMSVSLTSFHFLCLSPHQLTSLPRGRNTQRLPRWDHGYFSPPGIKVSATNEITYASVWGRWGGLTRYSYARTRGICFRRTRRLLLLLRNSLTSFRFLGPVGVVRKNGRLCVLFGCVGFKCGRWIISDIRFLKLSK